ncbi:MAG: pyruvate kinase [Sandaracinus sp.]
MNELLAQLRAASAQHASSIARVPETYRLGARNLVHYVTLRQHDLRTVQRDLSRLGLSSLGRIEGRVENTLESVRDRLDDVLGEPHRSGAPSAAERGPSWDEAEERLQSHAETLLGPRPPERRVSIMVTAPSAAEVTDAWMERLLAAGTNVLRINGAHEEARAWEHVVSTARRAATRLDAPLRIVVDMPGPKLRTVALEEGPRVLRFHAERDELGRTVSPARVAIGGPSASLGERSLALPDAVVSDLEIGDRLAFRDARDKKRALTIVGREDAHVLAETEETAYVVPETELRHERGGVERARIRPTHVPARPHRIRIDVGDRLALVRPGAAPPSHLPALGLTLEEAFASLGPGHRVLFDDGHAETVVEATTPTHAVLRVTHVRSAGLALGGEKGVNLPDTALDVPLLGEADERALAFARDHADAVGASFVRSPGDVHALHDRLRAIGADRLGVIWKIETTGAFVSLPAILLAALERAPVGVMIARGDLAIEAGYERLAELQEEILWLSEAAHLPVVWATQVLDAHAHTGRPTRAEITDAAMAGRAECVMLNKGPYVVEAVEALDDILRRMEQHQYKKRNLYRKLHLSLPAS